jgi:hypothetical protein
MTVEDPKKPPIRFNKPVSGFFRERIRPIAPALALLAFSGMLALAVLWWVMPVGVDWEFTFSQIPKIWRDPYQLWLFTNPPWIMALLPHAWLPLRLGNALNFLLNIFLIIGAGRAAGGGRMALALTLTSPVFFDLARTNNVDWIPLLGFVIGPAWGLPLLAAKPQALGGAAVVWVAEAFRRRAWRVFLPLAAVLAVSLAWGFWPAHLNVPKDVMWNFAPWPWGLPLGGWLLYRAIKTNDPFLGAASTPFLVPYLAPYSAAGLFGIAAARWPRVAQVIWVALWMYLIISVRRGG